MTHLRKIMLQELERRNYAQTTIDCYIRTVEHFSLYFSCSPDKLGPDHIREYQVALFKKMEVGAHRRLQARWLFPLPRTESGVLFLPGSPSRGEQSPVPVCSRHRPFQPVAVS